MLVLGLGGLMLSAISRVAVAGPAQIEAEGYAGSSVGQWTCGPTARANYGGVGGSARFYTGDQPPPAPPPEEQPNGGALEPDVEGAPPIARNEAPEPLPPELEPLGFSFGGGGGAESRGYTLVACKDTPCVPNVDRLPPTSVLGAGRANLGYDWSAFGFRAGALAFQRWGNNGDSSPTTNVIPDLDFRIGRRAGFSALIGVGAYNVSTMFRPGLSAGVAYTSAAWAAQLRAGPHATFDDQGGVRVDAAVRVALGRVVAPGLGVAVSSAERVSPEGRVFLVFTP